MTADEQIKSNKVYILKANDKSSYISSYEDNVFKFKDNISEAKYFTFSELINMYLKYDLKFEYLEIDLTPKPVKINIKLNY